MCDASEERQRARRAVIRGARVYGSAPSPAQSATYVGQRIRIHPDIGGRRPALVWPSRRRPADSGMVLSGRTMAPPGIRAFAHYSGCQYHSIESRDRRAGFFGSPQHRRRRRKRDGRVDRPLVKQSQYGVRGWSSNCRMSQAARIRCADRQGSLVARRRTATKATPRAQHQQKASTYSRSTFSISRSRLPSACPMKSDTYGSLVACCACRCRRAAVSLRSC